VNVVMKIQSNSTDSEEALGMAEEKTILFQGEDFPTFAERGFKPILTRFCEPLQGFAMQPIHAIEGKSVQPFWEGVDTPFLKAYIRPYSM
jgi:hypothetical protein